jgi:hypothetical protein
MTIANDQLAQLMALKGKVTEEALTGTGRHFVDGNYGNLTQCHHGDTGEYRNREDGQAVALLWNLWKAGAFEALATPTPAAEHKSIIERAARALCTAHYVERFKKAAEDPHVQMNVEGNYHAFEQQARTVLAIVPSAPQDTMQPMETAHVGQQIIAHEPLYGWLIVSKKADGSFIQKSSGNFWMDVPASVQFTHWLPYPRSLVDLDTHRCPICDEPFKPDDNCATDIELGTCHFDCLDGAPVVDLETGEEIADDDMHSFPYSEVMDPPSPAEREG